MEEVKSGSTFIQLLLAFLTAVLGIIVSYSIFLKRHNSETLKKESAAESAAISQAPVPAQPVQVSKKNAASAKLKALAAEKARQPRHHLDLVTLKGHGDAVTGVAFTSNGRGLATACADQDIGGAGLCMFAAGNGKAAAEAKAQGKLPLPEIKWDKQHIHAKNNITTLVGASSNYGSGDGSVIVATCSEGTDIKLWKAEDGRCVGTVDTNQLKNTMAALSYDGRFLAAAAFTADVKVWELIYSKDGQVQTVEKVMQLKGHKSAVTWLCFTWDSERIITASKDGTIRIWNINVRYQLDEDPKCLKVFPIPLQDAKGGVLLYERLAVSPDGKVLAVSHGHLLQWLSTETGAVLDTAEHAHDGEILSLVWSPQPVPTERGKAPILATASADKKVKLWFPPTP